MTSRLRISRESSISRLYVTTSVARDTASGRLFLGPLQSHCGVNNNVISTERLFQGLYPKKLPLTIETVFAPIARGNITDSLPRLSAKVLLFAVDSCGSRHWLCPNLRICEARLSDSYLALASRMFSLFFLRRISAPPFFDNKYATLSW